MATVIGMAEDKLVDLCSQAKPKSTIGNFLFPRGYVISGSSLSVVSVGERAKAEFGATVKPVPVSGAFHSPLMSSAVEKISSALESIDISLPPRIQVYSNVTGRPYSSADEIRKGLARQVMAPVHWEACVDHMMLREGGVVFVDVGPKRQLKAMLKRIDKAAYGRCVCAEA